MEGQNQGPEFQQPQKPITETEQLISEKKSESPIPRAPYSEVYEAEFLERYPEEKASVDIIFRELDEQIVDTYESYHSETFPGVSFSHIKLNVTPELIKKLRSTNPDAIPLPETTKPQQSKDQKWFLFTAFSPPPDGDALTVGDLGTDRFMRFLPMVARAMEAGETPPSVEIHLLGTPTGYAGSVTPEWVEDIKKDGFNTYGTLYAEYVQSNLPDNPEQLDKTRVVLQGVSKGAIVADNTYKNLPDHIKPHTQELLDNPAGNHKARPIVKYLSGLKVLNGLVGETIVRMVGDSTMKELMKKGKTYHEALFQRKGLTMEDTPEQTKLKRSAILQEGLKLLSGSPLDTENNRSFIRRAVFDPLTFNPLRLFNLWRESGRQIETVSQKLTRQEDELKKQQLLDLQEESKRVGMSDEEVKEQAQVIIDEPSRFQLELKETELVFPEEKAKQSLVVEQHGRALETTVNKKGHFFSLYQNWGRWKQNINFVKGGHHNPS